jgi:hypothetical protein
MNMLHRVLQMEVENFQVTILSTYIVHLHNYSISMFNFATSGKTIFLIGRHASVDYCSS